MVLPFRARNACKRCWYSARPGLGLGKVGGLEAMENHGWPPNRMEFKDFLIKLMMVLMVIMFFVSFMTVVMTIIYTIKDTPKI